MEERQMTAGEILDGLTRLENLFRPCAEARKIAEGVAGLEGQKNVIEREIREAEARKKVALREADTADSRLAAKQEELRRFIAPLEQKKSAEAARIERELAALQARYADEEKRLGEKWFEEKFAKQISERKGQIEALEAQRSDLENQVRETASQLKELKQRVALAVKAWQGGEAR
jgi:chromosome segregation ATPase